jgi:hypothetical protein
VKLQNLSQKFYFVDDADYAGGSSRVELVVLKPLGAGVAAVVASCALCSHIIIIIIFSHKFIQYIGRLEPGNKPLGCPSDILGFGSLDGGIELDLEEGAETT